jgi:hypothetical protein
VILIGDRRELAIGIATSGSTAGQFVIVPLIAYMLTAVSWRWRHWAACFSSPYSGDCSTDRQRPVSQLLRKRDLPVTTSEWRSRIL